MARSLAIRQGYRAYAIGLVALAGLTILESLEAASVSTTALGYGWLAMAGLGLLVLAGLVATRSETFVTDPTAERIERFENGPLGDTPIHAYAALLVLWSVVSVAWFASGRTILDATIVGYGWYAVALVGGVLTIGLAVRHSRALREAAPTPGSTGIEE